MQKQAADFAWSVVLGDQRQDRYIFLDLDDLGFESHLIDAISVKRLEAPYLRDDATRTDDARLGGVFHDEQVRFAAGTIGLGCEALDGFVDALFEQVAVLGERSETRPCQSC